MSKHNVTVMSGAGAMCQDCDWMYSPGCGHNAERNTYNAAFRHEEETAAVTPPKEGDEASGFVADSTLGPRTDPATGASTRESAEGHTEAET